MSASHSAKGLEFTAKYEYNENNQVVKTTNALNLYVTGTYNAHGDVVNLVNADGTVTQSYNYDAFGNEVSLSDTDTNPFRYCGEYWDAETGTYYLRQDIMRRISDGLRRWTMSDM